jgi:acyl carrier protein
VSQPPPEGTSGVPAAAISEEVRALVLHELAEPLDALGMSPDEVPDDFDLLLGGAIDSLGLLELITAVEERFGIEIDFEGLGAEELTVLGPFSRYVESAAALRSNGYRESA